jgi:hypothetical protein
MPGTRRRLPGSTRRKVGTTSSHHAPYAQGCKHATMAGTEGCDPARVSESHKAGLSSDWSLQLDSMKPELLVILDQHARVNTFPGLVHTARHTTKVGNTRSRWPNSQEREPSKVGSVIGVITSFLRSPFHIVGDRTITRCLDTQLVHWWVRRPARAGS